MQLRPTDGNVFSRLGGLPEMPAGFEWPKWNGRPQAFLAQLDLEELHRELHTCLPRAGKLYFFYDQEQAEWGFDPDHAGAWCVLHQPAGEVALVEHRAPAGLAPECIFKPKRVKPQRIEVLPDQDRLPPRTVASDDDIDDYEDFRAEAFAGLRRHQLLGFPSPIQGGGMEEDCQFASNGVRLSSPEDREDPRWQALKAGAAEWKLLLQLESDDDLGWMWGDAGTLYFWIRESDASRGDFSRVWMILQCG
ncbi:MAG: YwqG family protein [Planctomycetota bacterium]|nr:YwqG family protein [Planctomycetota bacterium]